LKRYAPFLLAAAVILADQLSKLWIVQNIPAYDWTQFRTILGEDFLRFIHVKNLGVALSIGQGSAPVIRLILFKIVPIPVMGYLAYLILNIEKEDLTSSFAWLLAGIMGGGIGNLIDRIFRSDGVVDWIDFKFYGILGWERFPTFNIADSAVFICAGLMMIFFIKKAVADEIEKREKKGENNE